MTEKEIGRKTQERTGKPTIIMTVATKEYLERKLEKAQAARAASQKGMGEAASDDDWHGNGVLDQFLHQMYTHESEVLMLSGLLQSTEIINPREETSEVRVGNEVTVRFQGEKEDEKYTILGPIDSITKPDWISSESPVGKAILHKKKGETVTYRVGKETREVTILDIQKGKF